MNADQLAAELVNDIFTWFPENYRTKRARNFSIQWAKSAIEKATEGWRRYALRVEHQQLESRAAHASESVRLAAERLRYECETTSEPESGFAKDILTLVGFAESHGVGHAATHIPFAPSAVSAIIQVATERAYDEGYDRGFDKGYLADESS